MICPRCGARSLHRVRVDSRDETTARIFYVCFRALPGCGLFAFEPYPPLGISKGDPCIHYMI